MTKLKCIIVEDEPLAAEIIKSYIKQVPFLQFVKETTDAIYALEILQKEAIDVVFLDIHLPGLKGLDFLKILKKHPQVILTTAYREYALEGYELNVVDYLLKPIHFNRFLSAVNKLTIVPSPPEQKTDELDKRHVFVNINRKNVKIYLDDIIYVESKREYIRINTYDSSFLIKHQLSDFETLLGTENFIRVHRSFIVSRKRVNAFSAVEVEIEGLSIPIGRNYKDQVLAILGGSII